MGTALGLNKNDLCSETMALTGLCELTIIQAAHKRIVNLSERTVFENSCEIFFN